jgi:peptidyl-prolyl cis-trans isomerase SurA
VYRRRCRCIAEKNTKMERFQNNQTEEIIILYKVNKVIPAAPKTFEECKKIINDYQMYLEQNWVGNLKKEFAVKVNRTYSKRVKNN